MHIKHFHIGEDVERARSTSATNVTKCGTACIDTVHTQYALTAGMASDSIVTRFVDATNAEAQM